MTYYLYQLRFQTPLHFGTANAGGGLEKSSYSSSADTLFSALCIEAAAANEALADELCACVGRGELRFSSLFPFYEERSANKLELYLPRPLSISERASSDLPEFSEMKQQATQSKKLKKLHYLRASEIKAFQAGALKEPTSRVFALEQVTTRVACRGSGAGPYSVASYTFHKDAGLYFIVCAANEKAVDLVTQLLELLGCSGIGGKRSSGYGKFSADDPLELAATPEEESDEAALLELLDDSKSSCQMCVAPIIPTEFDAMQADAATYKLLRRSGFLASSAVGTNSKKRDLYFLAEGSCFTQRFSGQLVELETAAPHPVLRYGLGMFVGL